MGGLFASGHRRPVRHRTSQVPHPLQRGRAGPRRGCDSRPDDGGDFVPQARRNLRRAARCFELLRTHSEAGKLLIQECFRLDDRRERCASTFVARREKLCCSRSRRLPARDWDHGAPSACCDARAPIALVESMTLSRWAAPYTSGGSPIQKLHVRQTQWSDGKKQGRPQAVGEIASAAERDSGLCRGCGADTPGET